MFTTKSRLHLLSYYILYQSAFQLPGSDWKGGGLSQCDGEKEDEGKRKRRVAHWTKQRGGGSRVGGEGCRTVSAYVRESPQIGHSLGSDGLILHWVECAHTTGTSTQHNTDTSILYSARGRGMTSFKGGCTMPHRSWSLKFNPAVKLEGLGCMFQQFQMPRSPQRGSLSRSLSQHCLSLSFLFPYTFLPLNPWQTCSEALYSL